MCVCVWWGGGKGAGAALLCVGGALLLLVAVAVAVAVAACVGGGGWEGGGQHSCGGHITSLKAVAVAGIWHSGHGGLAGCAHASYSLCGMWGDACHEKEVR